MITPPSGTIDLRMSGAFGAGVIDFVFVIVSLLISFYFFNIEWWCAALIGSIVYATLSLSYYGLASKFDWPRDRPFAFLWNFFLFFFP